VHIDGLDPLTGDDDLPASMRVGVDAPTRTGPAPAAISQSTKAMLAVPLVGASVLIDIGISSR
jgi:hypothetical protein